MTDTELLDWAHARKLEIGRESAQRWCVINHSREYERRYWLSSYGPYRGFPDRRSAGFSYGPIAVRGPTLRDALLAAVAQERNDVVLAEWAAEYDARANAEER